MLVMATPSCLMGMRNIYSVGWPAVEISVLAVMSLVLDSVTVIWICNYYTNLLMKGSLILHNGTVCFAQTRFINFSS